MRAGGFTIQQALTPDAANIIKQAITLARRRGHAQVTPLHVAHTMLSAAAGLLRTACLQSHSHPLQCKALELCFNVALNRLPASSSSVGPMLGPQNNSYSSHPSISNALVAAFKRAQAHQRRGSIESQQQPLLAVKIELEQLIISILDDPSVSRVMREAGFSSTQVKSNVEQAQAQSSSTKCKDGGTTTNLLVLSTPQIEPKSEAKHEDVMRVIENLMSKKRKNLVIVGECLDTIESIVRGVMSNEGLREVKFVRIPLSSLGHLSRGEREQKLGELKCLVKGFVEKGVVLYLGDLEWIIENRAGSGGSGQGRSYNYPVEEMIDELRKLACGGEGGRIWLLGIASFKTYMRCRNGYPSLESVWGLHAITIPAGSLGLSLIPESDVQSGSQSKKAGSGSSTWLVLESGDDQNKQLTCCVDCSANFNTEARSTRTTTFSGDSSSSSLPSWLKDENKRLNSNNDQDCVSVKELCKKWNSFCSSTHKQTITFASVSPSSSTSCFSFDRQNPNLTRTHQNWPVFEPKNSCRDHNFWPSTPIDKPCETSLRMFISLENPNSTPNSASSSDVMETEYVQRFKEFNAENLKTLCNALEKKVPWHKDIVPEIAGTVLQCRSGMLRRREKIKSGDIQTKEETWFVFQGVDTQAKEKIARELAKAVFGSHSSFVSIALSTFSSTRADSTEDLRNKRSRDEKGCSYIERLGEEVLVNPHRVFFVEDVEQADYCSQIGIKRAIERGIIVKSNGEEVSVSDAIVILSCESFSSRSRACSPPIKQKLDEEEKGCELMEETNPNCVSLDLNMCFDDGGDDEEDQSIDDIGLLECVDRCIIFKIQEL